jgi:hypothetical protein
MKKAVILFFFAFVFSVVVKAQLIKSISVSGGYAISTSNEYINLQNYPEHITVTQNPVQTWGAEVGVSFFEKKYFSIGLNIGVLNKLSETMYDADLSKIKPHPLQCFYVLVDELQQNHFNYIYLSPRISFHKKLKKYTPYFYISPRLDFLVAGKQSVIYTHDHSGKIYQESEKRKNEIENINPFLINGTFGVGLKRAISSKFSLGIELSNFLDFQPAIKQENASNLKFNNYAAFFTLQYSFTKK